MRDKKTSHSYLIYVCKTTSYYLKYFNDVVLHMIFKILIGIILLALFYFYMQPKIEEPKNMHRSFIPSDSFIGAKKGYVFKMDSKGLGYYLDN